MKIVSVLLIALFACLNVAGDSIAAETNNDVYLKWFKSANAKVRLASTYLRTGNVDFAAIALEEIIESKVPERLPTSLDGLVKTTVSQTKSALTLIDANESGDARNVLLQLRQKIFQQHQTWKIVVFDDCIWALISRGPPLWKFRKNRPDLADRQQSQAVVKATLNYLRQLNKCDSMATPAMKANADYHRLVSGARESLERIPVEAIAQKDGGLLYRFIIELRSFDRLLYFRFG